MKKTLIISGHHDLKHSKANRQIIEKLTDLAGVTFYDLKTDYPDGKFDVESEQTRLENADLIIFQFPFVWYGMPSHLRAWMEQVFAFGFAYGEGGMRLKDKKFLLSITLGGNETAYSTEGHNRFPVETFLLPIELFARYCGLQYLDPVYSYNMGTSLQTDYAALNYRIDLHANKVKEVIDSLNQVSINHTVLNPVAIAV